MGSCFEASAMMCSIFPLVLTMPVWCVEDMDKPASVYKPQRRQKLIDDGYELVGSFGDQFSDLDGTSQAQASWKLPNPMYYIL